MTVPAVPGPGFVVVQPKLGLGDLEGFLDPLRSYSPRYRAWNLGCSAQRWPSTATSVSIVVPAGHQVEK